MVRAWGSTTPPATKTRPKIGKEKTRHRGKTRQQRKHETTEEKSPPSIHSSIHSSPTPRPAYSQVRGGVRENPFDPVQPQARLGEPALGGRGRRLPGDGGGAGCGRPRGLHGVVAGTVPPPLVKKRKKRDVTVLDVVSEVRRQREEIGGRIFGRVRFLWELSCLLSG